MAIENRDLKPGMKLVATYKKKSYSAEVVQTDEGLRIKLPDGKTYKSVSSAGNAITGGSVNGWRFWSIEGESAPAKPVKKPTAKKSGSGESPTKTPAKKTSARSPKPDKVPDKPTVATASRDSAIQAEKQDS